MVRPNEEFALKSLVELREVVGELALVLAEKCETHLERVCALAMLNDFVNYSQTEQL